MRISLSVFFCIWFFQLTSAQELVQVVCNVDMETYKVYETYHVSNTIQVEFSLDQTQKLRSFTGYFWVGKKKCKIKKKKLNIHVDVSNVNNPVTNYSFEFSNGKIPTNVEYIYEVIRDEVMYLSTFNFDKAKNHDLSIKVPSQFQVSFDAAQPITLDKAISSSGSAYNFRHSSNPNDEEAAILKLMIHPKDQNPNDYFKNWYLSLIEKQMQLSDESRNKIEAIVEKGSNKREKAVLFYNYIRDHINYYGHETGLNMIQPENVNKVLFYKFGDCKDIALLLHAGLNFLNCKSYFGLMNLNNDLTATFYISSFNHAICVLDVDGELIFLDATDKKSSFTKMSNLLTAKKVLMLSENESSTTTILPKL